MLDKEKETVGENMENEINLQEVYGILSVSRRAVSRYIKKGLLNPDRVKGEKGILEYLFSRSEVKE